jgi:hypothetical protein
MPIIVNSSYIGVNWSKNEVARAAFLVICSGFSTPVEDVRADSDCQFRF